MAEPSQRRVTITFGRTGQVVNRAATVSDLEYGDPMQMKSAGSKRSVRDRLGGNFNGLSSRNEVQPNTKRQRGEILSSNGLEAARIGKDDLRLKLMQKNASRRSASIYDQNTMDLREKLSRTVQSPGVSLRTLDTRQHVTVPKESSILGRIPSTRSADDLPRMDSFRNSYSPWTLDHIRSRSPDRVIRSSKGLSSPRNAKEVQRRPSSQTFDDARAVSYMNKNVLDAQRPVNGSTSFMGRPVLATVSTKPAASVLGQVPPPSGILQKSPYMVEEQQTVESLLYSLGLGKYAILFKAEEVDMTALKQMGERDLKELGIPMGPRKKILLALLPRSKRQP